MFSKDIGIDLGTANVLIHVKNKGIVLNEPAVVALDRNTGKVLAVGKEAYEMLGKTPKNIEAIRPLKEGVIADFDVTEIMLTHFINSINVKGFLSKPRMLICCPTNTTKVEQKAIKQAAENSGAKEVILEEEPKVALVGAGVDIYQPGGNMVIDIGGGTTDIAVVSMGNIVTAKSIKLAGDTFDQDILEYIKKEYKLFIGIKTAEEIKITAATVYQGARDEEMSIWGRDIESGLPRTVTIHSDEIEKALRESIQLITEAARSVLEKTPPELSADIIDRGIIITGGGALIHGIDKLLADKLEVPAFVVEDPMNCVAKGTGLMLANLDQAIKA